MTNRPALIGAYTEAEITAANRRHDAYYGFDPKVYSAGYTRLPWPVFKPVAGIDNRMRTDDLDKMVLAAQHD